MSNENHNLNYIPVYTSNRPSTPSDTRNHVLPSGFTSHSNSLYDLDVHSAGFKLPYQEMPSGQHLHNGHHSMAACEAEEASRQLEDQARQHRESLALTYSAPIPSPASSDPDLQPFSQLPAASQAARPTTPPPKACILPLSPHNSPRKHSEGYKRVPGAKPGKPIKPRGKITGDHLIILVRVALKIHPFLVGHNEKTKAWTALRDESIKAGFPHHGIKPDTLRKKVFALVKWKKNPKSMDQEVRSIARLMNEDISTTISGILERLVSEYDDAKHQSDEVKKAKLQKIQEDEEGGEALRRASMKTLHHRKRDEMSDSDINGSESDKSEVSGSDTSVTSTESQYLRMPNDIPPSKEWLKGCQKAIEKEKVKNRAKRNGEKKLKYSAKRARHSSHSGSTTEFHEQLLSTMEKDNQRREQSRRRFEEATTSMLSNLTDTITTFVQSQGSSSDTNRQDEGYLSEEVF